MNKKSVYFDIFNKKSLCIGYATILELRAFITSTTDFKKG